MRTGVQSLGWYVLRAPDPVPLIKFYRDVVGLGVLRGRETPPEQASAMMWAGGTTVFEPNRLTRIADTAPENLDSSPYVPVFRSRNLAKTLSRLATCKVEVERHGTSYFRDPLGFFFGMAAADTHAPDRLDRRTGQPLTVPDSDAPMADDLLDLGGLEVRSDNPETLCAFYEQVLQVTQVGKLSLDMGDGAVMTFLSGESGHVPTAEDREAVPIVPVFRVYGYDAFVERAAKNGARQLQEVNLTGGRIWYGWDAADRLFGFQERRPPDPDPDKWTTRLPEDVLARKLWDVV